MRFGSGMTLVLILTVGLLSGILINTSLFSSSSVRLTVDVQSQLAAASEDSCPPLFHDEMTTATLQCSEHQCVMSDGKPGICGAVVATMVRVTDEEGNLIGYNPFGKYHENKISRGEEIEGEVVEGYTCGCVIDPGPPIPDIPDNPGPPPPDDQGPGPSTPGSPARSPGQ